LASPGAISPVFATLTNSGIVRLPVVSAYARGLGAEGLKCFRPGLLYSTG
jgi:hypothetical protein